MPRRPIRPPSSFFLGTGADPAQALTLAQRNVAVARTGESLTLLARSLLASGQPGGAREAVTEVEATPYRAVGFLRAAVDVLAANGDNAHAAAYRAQLDSQVVER